MADARDESLNESASDTCSPAVGALHVYNRFAFSASFLHTLFSANYFASWIPFFKRGLVSITGNLKEETMVISCVLFPALFFGNFI